MDHPLVETADTTPLLGKAPSQSSLEAFSRDSLESSPSLQKISPTLIGSDLESPVKTEICSLSDQETASLSSLQGKHENETNKTGQ